MCAVKFPNEIRVHVQLPEQISDEQVDRLIDKIPPTLGQRKVKTRVEISSGTGTTVKEEKLGKITATIISLDIYWIFSYPCENGQLLFKF